ncbi:MAG: Deoxyribose-phosphate aldolase [Lasallia pustulata]|uniref:Deoxyribose-phosphate aldolase n=1 Tax=Lasallia pustulata TaxID=136370 RepID=A0A1W5CUN3_9LECA|nr:MAG: Deoxyribose-phosphate aldolase [Lasallia pustulata]SLM34604.1 hypothetical protein LPUS_03458 [Lasallia pustulata]
MTTPSRPYLSEGQVLQGPPFSARVRSFVDSIYFFLGLYVTTLFSLDAYAAAEVSPFNVENRKASRAGLGGGGWGGSGGGGGGYGGGGPGSGGGAGKKTGRVDDIRGPECKSCG